MNPIIPKEVRQFIKQLVDVKTSAIETKFKSDLQDALILIDELKEEIYQLKLDIEILKDGGNI